LEGCGSKLRFESCPHHERLAATRVNWAGGVGAQLGYIIPMGDLQGYFNVKAYKEFESVPRAGTSG
jgi:hypothetical protein